MMMASNAKDLKVTFIYESSLAPHEVTKNITGSACIIDRKGMRERTVYISCMYNETKSCTINQSVEGN
jgi:hypothetical protein